MKDFNMEKWIDIKGFEGYYQISDLGRIRSVDRYVNSPNGRRISKGSLLNPSKLKSGYISTRLYKNGKGKTYTVHKLSIMSFLNIESDRENHIDHINFDKSDNRLSNLRVISARENTSRVKRGSSSKYVGVYFMKSRSKWDARIKFLGKVKHLGYFDDEYQAHLAYEKEKSKYE
jgi:hypothetical protein